MLVMWYFTWYQLCCLSECGYIHIDLTEIVTDTDHPDIYWIKDLMWYKEDKSVIAWSLAD